MKTYAQDKTRDRKQQILDYYKILDAYYKQLPNLPEVIGEVRRTQALLSNLMTAIDQDKIIRSKF